MGIPVSDILITGVSKKFYDCLTCLDNNVDLSFIATTYNFKWFLLTI